MFKVAPSGKSITPFAVVKVRDEFKMQEKMVGG